MTKYKVTFVIEVVIESKKMPTKDEAWNYLADVMERIIFEPKYKNEQDELLSIEVMQG